MDTILPEELNNLFPSSDDEARSDKDLTHILQKARKYGRPKARCNNPGKRKNKYERYLHAGGALLAKKAGGDVGNAVGGRYGAAAGRLVGLFAANPGRFGDDPGRLVAAAVGRPRRRGGRRRGGRRRGGRRGGGRGGHGRARGGRHGHRGLDGGSSQQQRGGGEGERERGSSSSEEEEDGSSSGSSSDSSGTSSDWGF